MDMLAQFEAAVLRTELEDMAEEKERQYNRAEILEKRLEVARAAAERYAMSESAAVARQMAADSEAQDMAQRLASAEKRIQELEKCVAECLVLLVEQ